MNASIHEKIAGHSQADQQVGTEEKQVVIEKEIKPREGCVQQQAGSDEEQPPMQLGLPASNDGKGYEGAERDHVENRNNEKGLDARLMELVCIEPTHHDRGCDAQWSHRCPKRRSEPSQETMPLHISCADQNGLKQEEGNPSGNAAA